MRLISGGLALVLCLSLLSPSPSSGGENATRGSFSRAEAAELLRYARNCLLARLDGVSPPPLPAFATKRQRACFVTFFHGRKVFACFGGFTPRRASLAEEIAENVRLALANDVRSRGLSRVTALSAGIQITFPTGQPEPVNDYSRIDPLREGMFVETGENGVAFVPGEARTAGWAFREALRRLGAAKQDEVRVYRFAATAVATGNETSERKK